MADAPTPIDQRLIKLLHHRTGALQRSAPIALPIVHTSAYHLPDDPQDGDLFYTRDGNPTWTAVETQLAILEDASVVTFPSGMAAIAAIVFTQLRPGDRLILPSDGYYVVRALADEALRPMGIDVMYWPTADYANAPLEGAKLVWLETPSNPGLDVCDLANLAARARAAGALTVADNTTLTPLLQQPLDLGIDAVAMSDTKAMAGHGDVLFGHVASRNTEIVAAVKRWRKLAGSIPGPAEAALVHRGLETLEVRLNRMCANAMMIAERLEQHPAVKTVRYPGLPGDPAHVTMRKQASNFGFVIGFTLADKSAAEHFLAACKSLVSATSFGSVHTSAERRARWGDDVPEGFIRLSVGCEPAEPLWQDIAAALSPSAETV